MQSEVLVSSVMNCVRREVLSAVMNCVRREVLSAVMNCVQRGTVSGQMHNSKGLMAHRTSLSI